MTALPGLEHHPHARAVLSAGLPPDGAPSHAYLFGGPGGTGKRAVARAFAAELLADGAADPKETRERVLRGAHPDLTWVRPSGAAELLVGDVDEPVVGAATRTPFEARRRVFVIEGADAMTDAAANRMLKTLEEPAAYAHLVLVSDRPTEVLPTIVSRCQRVRFDPLPEEELVRRLGARGVGGPAAVAAARLSLGDFDRALALALGEGPALRDAAERFARTPLDGRPWTALAERAKASGEAAVAPLDAAFAEERELIPQKERRRRETEHTERVRRARRRAEREALTLSLRLVELWYRDLACVSAGAEELVHHADRLQELRSDAAGRDEHRLREAVSMVGDTRERLLLNVTEELALEALAYRLAA